MKQIVKILKFYSVTFIILAGVALFTSCEKHSYIIEEGDPTVPVLYKTQIQPIFTASCVMCHKGSKDPDLRVENSFKSLSDRKYLNLPAESSGLYLTIIKSSHSSYTLPEEKFTILYWIQQGAKDN